MDIKKFLTEYQRMCKSYKNCSVCSLTSKSCFSNGVTYKTSEEVNKIIEAVTQWSLAHPQKTYAQDFFEKFPSANKAPNGTPSMWFHSIHGGAIQIDTKYDEMRWNSPIEEHNG